MESQRTSIRSEGSRNEQNLERLTSSYAEAVVHGVAVAYAKPMEKLAE